MSVKAIYEKKYWGNCGEEFSHFFNHKEKEKKIDNNEYNILDDEDDLLDPSNKTQRPNFDLSSLNGNSWLTDDVINEYEKLIRE